MAIAPVDVGDFARCSWAHTAVCTDRLHFGGLLIVVRVVQ
jgi:hypothetical protein